MNGRRTTVAVHAGTGTILAVNLIMTALAAGLLMYYVVVANGLAARTWKYTDAQKQMRTLTETRNTLIAQQAAFEDRDHLAELATRAGFVPVGSIEHVIQPSPVAAR